jgi:hypothetical protein
MPFESSFGMDRNYRTIINGRNEKFSCIKLQEYSPSVECSLEDICVKRRA